METVKHPLSLFQTFCENTTFHCHHCIFVLCVCSHEISLSLRDFATGRGVWKGLNVRSDIP